mmetsp:Transcript_7555/g.18737  ORF Transcript_7555/g.18737 Transcript_7555/m.18737 type:complete len:118 (+) Transcript_7555:111-464(+)
MSEDDKPILQRSQSIKRFRVIATVVKALNRWQSALNPTYTYTKDAKEATFQKRQAVIAQARTMSAQPHNASLPKSGSLLRSGSGRTASGRPAEGTHYGHKGNMLFKPLPEPESTKAS